MSVGVKLKNNPFKSLTDDLGKKKTIGYITRVKSYPRPFPLECAPKGEETLYMRGPLLKGRKSGVGFMVI